DSDSDPDQGYAFMHLDQPAVVTALVRDAAAAELHALLVEWEVKTHFADHRAMQRPRQDRDRRPHGVFDRELALAECDEAALGVDLLDAAMRLGDQDPEIGDRVVDAATVAAGAEQEQLGLPPPAAKRLADGPLEGLIVRTRIAVPGPLGALGAR